MLPAVLLLSLLCVNYVLDAATPAKTPEGRWMQSNPFRICDSGPDHRHGGHGEGKGRSDYALLHNLVLFSCLFNYVCIGIAHPCCWQLVARNNDTSILHVELIHFPTVLTVCDFFCFSSINKVLNI